MSIVGIVAEYNPFHLGHQYHISRTRELAGKESTVVCVMSGDYVQRGEAAIAPKHLRAEAACRCGADLVIELPLPWCLSSAEGFARGAVSLLDAVGCETLSFGIETETLCPLEDLAELLMRDETHAEILRYLEENPNMSYPAARQKAIAALDGAGAPLLETPNNILALEYLKALRQLNAKMMPLGIQRCKSRHDGTGGEWKSGSELRKLLLQGNTIGDFIPKEAAALFAGEPLPHYQPEALEIAMLSRLRAMHEADFDSLPDAAEGLGRRLYRAAAEEPSIEAVMNAAKSKRYTMSRVRRAICCAVLGVRAGMTDEPPHYARVLAANTRGREYLSRLRGAAGVSIITKPAAVRGLDKESVEIFDLGARAHDLLALCSEQSELRRGGEDWRKGPVIL